MKAKELAVTIQRLRDEGKKNPEIARILGKSLRTIQRITKEEDGTPDIETGEPVRLDELTEETICESVLRKELSVEEAAMIMGVTSRTIYRRLKEHDRISARKSG